MAYNVLDIARYVINYANEKEAPISNLKLQKILYYIQAKFLVEKGERCFKEDIVNWTYGPVIEKAYNEFRQFGHREITPQNKYEEIEYDTNSRSIKVLIKDFKDEFLENNDKELIKNVVEQYCKYKPFELVKKTHEENPWKNSKQNDVIGIDIIREYYTNNPEKL